MRLDGAEHAPRDGHNEDSVRIPSLPRIKDGLETSSGWCVRPVEEKKKDRDCHLHNHLES